MNAVPDADANAIVDYLVYCNYAHNRNLSPHLTVEQWRKIYGAQTDALESRYQKEQHEAKIHR